ncbi:TnsA-like heteromeric transposase endonuclease subunit [Streptomyces sp. Agncl-13]|uniref:TnsA-like heteromeric transposase endonuclease subunit n=1 Tax=Streptomyces sp. Agncl-13 TaxID=3400628 RepID=UPI003A86B042
MAVPAGVDQAGPCIELSYVDAVHGRRRRPLRDCVTGRFEDVDPVRTFRRSRGERHFPGWYWSATTGWHVGFESWLERDRLLLMDSDPSVVGISSQPFWLHWHDGERERRHAPDYFIRRADGSAMVVDVRADERIEPKDAEAFEVTRMVCAQAGVEVRPAGDTGRGAAGEYPVAVALPDTRGVCTTRPRPGSGRPSQPGDRSWRGRTRPGTGCRRCPCCSTSSGSRS